MVTTIKVSKIEATVLVLRHFLTNLLTEYRRDAVLDVEKPSNKLGLGLFARLKELVVVSNNECLHMLNHSLLGNSLNIRLRT